MIVKRMLDFPQGIEKLKRHMKSAFGIEEVRVTMAKQEKDQTNEKDVWRYNVEFTENGKVVKAMVEINAVTGDLLLFQRDSQWRI
ncbi:MAG: hypothetical protein ACP5UO_00820 [Thermoplasmata archaeon]